MKSLIDKCYNLLQMNVQVPNIPFNNISPTFYEDFKDYCKTDEWRIFVQKQVSPLLQLPRTLKIKLFNSPRDLRIQR